MAEVCPRPSSYIRKWVHPSKKHRSIDLFRLHRPDAQVLLRPTTSPSQYQNPVENAYRLLPRPPQAQAAHFKRLYRK